MIDSPVSDTVRTILRASARAWALGHDSLATALARAGWAAVPPGEDFVDLADVGPYDDCDDCDEEPR